jgi:hypothetical protein
MRGKITKSIVRLSYRLNAACLLILLCLLLTGSAAAAVGTTPRLSQDPLTDEEIAVYRKVIQEYLARRASIRQLNVADRTVPLDQTVFLRASCHKEDPPQVLGERVRICLDLDKTGIPFTAGEEKQTIHKLDDSIVSGLDAVVVDPEKQRDKAGSIQAGLFTM